MIVVKGRMRLHDKLDALIDAVEILEAEVRALRLGWEDPPTKFAKMAERLEVIAKQCEATQDVLTRLDNRWP